MKYSVTTYSFAALMDKGEMTQMDCITRAQEMGFDGIEFSEIVEPAGTTKEDYAVQLREACAAAGLAVVNYTFGADFLNGCDGDTAAEIKRVKRHIDIAVLLGAKSVRHDATWGSRPSADGYRGFMQVLPILADACREVTVYAATRGIRTMVENHGYFCQDSDRVEQLINAVAHPNFGWLVDIGNFLCADEDPILAVGRAIPYVFHAHAKDFHIKSGDGPNPGEGFFQSRGGNYLRGSIIGHGNAPVTACVRNLIRNGYDGYLTVEFEGMEPCLTGIRLGLEFLKSIG